MKNSGRFTVLFSSILIGFIFFLSSNNFAQDSENCNLISHWNHGPCKDIAVDGNIVFFTDGASIVIMDFSDPSDPIELSRTLIPVIPELLLINGDKLFFVDSDRILYCYNISDLTNPAEIGNYSLNHYVSDADIIGNHLIFSSNSGYYVLDVTDPADISESIFLQDQFASKKIMINSTHAYLAGYDSTMYILDISDVSNPIVAGSLKHDKQIQDVVSAGSYAYLSDSYGTLRVIDCSDLSNPTEVSFYSRGSVGQELVCVDNYVYMSFSSNGLSIIDISDPLLPQIVKTIYTDGNVYQVASTGSMIYLSVDYGSMIAVNASNVDEPVEVGKYAYSSSLGIFADKNNCYLANGLNGLYSFDVSDSSNPILLSNFDTRGWGIDVVVSGTNALYAAGGLGLRIVDITDPSNPTELGSYNPGGNLRSLAVTGNYVCLAYSTDGLKIVDITDISNPVLTGELNIDGEVKTVSIKNNYAYIACGSKGFRIVDITDPASPTEISYTATNDNTKDVMVSGDFAYVAEDHAGIRIFNISDVLSAVVEVGTFDTDGQAEAVFAFGDYAYVADGQKGLRIIDVSDPANPVEVGFYNTGYFANNVFAINNKAYVTDELAGFYMFEYNNTTNIGQGNIANQFSLEQNYPNPFNPTTIIEYNLSNKDFVDLSIYNILGEKVKTLFSGIQTPGNYMLNFDGSSISSGVYYYKIMTDQNIKVRKMILLK